jgi:hypothetical protein
MGVNRLIARLDITALAELSTGRSRLPPKSWPTLSKGCLSRCQRSKQKPKGSHVCCPERSQVTCEAIRFQKK